jgi:hypothetical protein
VADDAIDTGVCNGAPAEKEISIKFEATSGGVTNKLKGFTLTIKNVCGTTAVLRQDPN